MKSLVSAFAVGIIFGTGIAISGMANPAKVLNFFDLAGTWDPSLIFVMGGALVTAAIGYAIVFKTRIKPIFDDVFAVPMTKDIDASLIGGSALFGVGWGIAGFCPGGAVPALGLGYSETFIFIAAMVAGIVLGRSLKARTLATARA